MSENQQPQSDERVDARQTISDDQLKQVDGGGKLQPRRTSRNASGHVSDAILVTIDPE